MSSCRLMYHTKDKHKAICLPKLFEKVQVHCSAIISLVTAVFSYPMGRMLSYLHLSVRTEKPQEYLTYAYFPLHDDCLAHLLVYLLVLPIRS